MILSKTNIWYHETICKNKVYDLVIIVVKPILEIKCHKKLNKEGHLLEVITHYYLLLLRIKAYKG